MALDEPLLAHLFHLNNCGKKINGQEFTKETLEGTVMLVNVEAMVEELLRLFKVLRVEIRTKVLDQMTWG